jgi:hypothetical protein
MATGNRTTVHERGLSLVELLVSSVVGLVVFGAIFTLISLTGRSTKQIAALQQLAQESTLISEKFVRSVRNGNVICTGASTAAPSADTNNVSQITIRNASLTALYSYGISGDSLALDGSKYRTGYTCQFRSPASHFKVFQNGKHVEFYLSMYKVVARDTISYTQTTGDVRCKN